MKRNKIKLAIMATAFILVGTVLTARPANAETHFSLGIGVAPAYDYLRTSSRPLPARPIAPGPEYYWTDGYYNPYGVWVGGYWAPRAYVAPYYRRYDRDDYRRYDRDDYRRYDRHEFHGRGHAYGWRR